MQNYPSDCPVFNMNGRDLQAFLFMSLDFLVWSAILYRYGGASVDLYVRVLQGICPVFV